MSADSNISTPVFGSTSHGTIICPERATNAVAARAALRDVVQPVRQLELAERLAHDAAERRRLEGPELERLLGVRRAPVAAAAPEPRQTPATIDDSVGERRRAPSASGTRPSPYSANR